MGLRRGPHSQSGPRDCGQGVCLGHKFLLTDSNHAAVCRSVHSPMPSTLDRKTDAIWAVNKVVKKNEDCGLGATHFVKISQRSGISSGSLAMFTAIRRLIARVAQHLCARCHIPANRAALTF
jgi:hypothetical protein